MKLQWVTTRSQKHFQTRLKRYNSLSANAKFIGVLCDDHRKCQQSMRIGIGSTFLLVPFWKPMRLPNDDDSHRNLESSPTKAIKNATGRPGDDWWKQQRIQSSETLL